MDKGTMVGLLLAFGGVVVGVAMEGGRLMTFVSLSSFFIVVVGSFGAMMLAFPLHVSLRFGRCLGLLLRGRTHDWDGAVRHIVAIATQARRNGVLSLETTIHQEKNEFIRAGLRMMVDGADTDVLEQVLDARLQSHASLGKQDEKMFETLGGFMPTMGIVGTVTSLIHALGNLSEPDKLGQAIATAFTATLYGVGLANLAVLPIAGKMRSLGQEEMDYYRMISSGLVAVQSGDNPLWVEQRMRAYVPKHVLAGTATKKAKEAPKAEAKTVAA